MKTKRRFIIGEEWLYMKLYSGPKKLEEILINDILPVAEHSYNSNIINNFFFVRYMDNGYHLRLRFKLCTKKKLSPLLSILSKKLSIYADNRVLYKVTTDTYNREFEKYGESVIEDIETIFGIDSWEILQTLKHEEDYENRWLYSIKIMDNLLTGFELTTEEKHALCQDYYLGYQQEFENSPYTKESLKTKYRGYQAKIEEIINLNHSAVQKIIGPLPDKIVNIDFPIKHILEQRKNNLLGVPFNELLKNLMHMHYNRSFRIKQRHHEFVIYYMMSNFYKSLHIRQKQMK
jgi:thiopeptide-type bacteriocin biosynthesis protein